MKLRFVAGLSAVLVSLSGLVVLASPVAAAGPVPGITLAKSGPSSLLSDDPATFTLTAANPSSNTAAVPEYNTSFRDVLPAGVSYVAGTTSPSDVGEPTVLANQPATGQTTLIWSNAFDLQVGATSAITFQLEASDSVYPVGAKFANTANAYASTAPRVVPKFTSTGTLTPGQTSVQSATSNTTTTTISAIAVSKSEPSVESKLLRGVHNNTTVYSVAVSNNAFDPTNAVSVTDYLPADQEFLGCGGVDHSSGPEYPGAPSLTATPVIPAPGSGANPTGCLTPASVATVLNPTGYPAGVYTAITWNIGTLSPNEVYTLQYAAGIPLRENVMFPAGTPTTGVQAANLDNNTGAPTRQNAAAASSENFVHAAGTYTGTVAPGTSTAVTADGNHTVTVNDLRIHKTVSPGQFTSGGVATYTLTIDASEYENASAITVTDVLPNGVCPLDNTRNYAPGAPSDCAPGAGFVPSTAYQSVSYDPSTGQFTVTFRPIAAVAADGTATITYQARMRTIYTGGSLAGSPTSAGDSFTNSVTEQGSTTPIPANPVDSGVLGVHDSSEATQTTSEGSLTKEVGERATPMDCGAATYDGLLSPVPPALTFVKGDRVCFRITAPFATTTQTRSPVLTDFLPDNLSYETASFQLGSGNTVPADEISFDESAAESSGTLTWTLGAKEPDGTLAVPKGSTFVAVFSAVVTGAAAGPAPDVDGNVVKLRSTDSYGNAQSLRANVNFAVAPVPVGIVKGVAAVNGITNPGGGDHVGVREGDDVTFHVDVSNTSNATTSVPPITMSSIDLWDVLPQGITCAAVNTISDGGVCTNPGDPGQPTFAQRATLSAIVWTGPVLLLPGSSHSYTYHVVIPAGTSVASDLVNTASVRSYNASTDLGSTSVATYYPASNIDTNVDPALEDPNPASDNSDVFLPSASVSKLVTSAINGTGNVGAETPPGAASTQATIGESVTFTVSARIPAHTTVYGGSLTDPLPTGLAQDSITAQFAPNAGTPVYQPLPTGFSLNAATNTVSFATPYDNTTTTDQLVTLVITAHVTTAAANKAGVALTNTGTFTSSAGPSGTAPAAQTGKATVNVVEPSPSLLKSNNLPAATKTVAGGTTVTYTLVAGNAAGKPTLHDAWVVDCVPNGVIFGAFVNPIPGNGATETTAAGPGGNNTSCAAGTQEIDWNVGDLAAGQSLTLNYTGVVAVSAVGSAVYTNNAALTGNSLAGPRSTPTAPGNPLGRSYAKTASSSVKVAGATITKSASPTNPTVGQTVTYTGSVTLPANVNFYNLSLIDVLPVGIDASSVNLSSITCTNKDGSGCSLTTATPLTRTGQTVGWFVGNALTATQDRVVTVVYTAKVADVSTVKAGVSLINALSDKWNLATGPAPTSATATFDETNGPATATVTVREPSVSITKAVSNPHPQPGQSFTYAVQVTNASGVNVSDADNVVVTDVLPTGVVVDPTSIAGGGVLTGADPVTGGGTITWTIPDLAPGTTYLSPAGLTYSATLAPSAGIDTTPLTNTATVTSYTSLPTGGRSYTGPAAPAQVGPQFPALSAAKTTPNGTTAYVGAPFTWQLTVTDTGAGTAYGVGAVDTLPPNWTYTGPTQVSVNHASPVDVEPTITTTGAVSTLTWTGLGVLPPGASVVITYSATPGPEATTDPGAGSTVAQTNTVAPTGTDETGASGNHAGSYAGPPASASAHIDSADVQILKEVGTPPVAGASGSWTLTVSNNGPDAATGPFTVTDPFDDPAPAGVTNVSASGPGWSCTAAPITCQRTTAADTLAPGAAFPPITVGYSVAAGVNPGTVLHNTATVSAHTFDPDLSDNTSSADAPVDTVADLGIVKTLTSPLIAGRPATYAINVTNYGPSVSRGPITVNDTLPSGTTFVSADGGTDWTCAPPSGGTLTCVDANDLAVGAAPQQIIVTVNVASGQTAAVLNSATVVPTTPEPTPDPHPDTSQVSATPTLSADLAITKDLQGQITAGSPATYTLTVVNNGPSDATAPVVTDTLPASLSFRSATGPDWSCSAVGQTVTCDYTAAGAMPAGATSAITLVVGTQSSLTGAVENTATVSSTTPDPDPANNSSTSNSDIQERADLAIAKTHTGTPVAGQSFVYHLAVHNNGPSDEAGPITVTDQIPAGLTYQSATGTGWSCDYADPSRLLTCTGAEGLADGADAAVIDVTVLVDHDTLAGTVTNTAQVTGNPGSPDPNPGNNSADDTATITTSSELTLTKTLDTPTPVVAGTQATFTLQVTNAGPSDAQSVTVTDTLPNHLSYVSATGDGWSCAAAGQQVVCSRAVVPADPPAADVAPITLVTLVDPSTPVDPPGSTTTLVNTAVVDTATAGPIHNPPPVDVPVVASADLSLTKTAGSSSVDAGLATTWTLAVHNAGPSDAAGPITITDQLPGYESYLSSSGAGWACTAGAVPNPPGPTAQQSVTCTLAAALAAGGDAPALTLLVGIDPTAPNGKHTNSATVSSPAPDPDPSNNTASATLTVGRDVDLTITKTHSGDGQVGGPLSFQLTVANTGVSTGDQIVVTDPLPAGLTYVSATGTGWTCAAVDQLVTCQLAGDLGPNSTAPVITVVATVLASAYPSVTNTATVASTDPEITSTDAASDPVTVDPDAQLTISKTHVGSLQVGQTGTYRIVVTDSGPTPAPGPITVTDPLPAGLTYRSAGGPGWSCSAAGATITCVFAGSLALGASATITVSVNVGSAALPSVTNTATATAPGSSDVTGRDTAPVAPGGSGILGESTGSGGSGGNGGSGVDGLADTGTDSSWWLQLGALLLLGGAVVLALARRRRV